MLDVLAALVPSIGVGLIFWFAMRAIIHADRRERAAIAALDRQDSGSQASAEPRSAPGGPIEAPSSGDSTTVARDDP